MPPQFATPFCHQTCVRHIVCIKNRKAADHSECEVPHCIWNTIRLCHHQVCSIFDAFGSQATARIQWTSKLQAWMAAWTILETKRCWQEVFLQGLAVDFCWSCLDHACCQLEVGNVSSESCTLGSRMQCVRQGLHDWKVIGWGWGWRWRGGDARGRAGRRGGEREKLKNLYSPPPGWGEREIEIEPKVFSFTAFRNEVLQSFIPPWQSCNLLFWFSAQKPFSIWQWI